MHHVLDRLKPEQLERLEWVVVIGVEENKLPQWKRETKNYKERAKNAHWKHVYRNDPQPPLTHIDGPRALLMELR